MSQMTKSAAQAVTESALARRLAQEGVHHTDPIFRLLVESVKDYAIFLLDPEGRVSSWNAGAERIKGYTTGEILGKHFSIFYPPETLVGEWPDQELKIAIQEGRFEGEGWRLRKDGTRFWADVVITPLYRDGRLQGFAKVTRDLTERKAAEERLQASEVKYRLLVSGVKDYAIFMLDPQGYVETWNDGAQAISGYTPEEIVGRHFSAFYPEEARGAGWPERELRIAEEQGRFVDETWRVGKDGRKFWASVVLTALRESGGELYGFSKVIRDMSERKQRDEEIQKLNEELRIHVEQLNESQRAVELRTIQLQRLSGELLRVQDEERRRVARELHDELGQELAGLKMILESENRKTNGRNARSEAIVLVDRTIRTVRNLSYLLHPPLLDEAGLSAALQWYVGGLMKRSEMKIELQVTPASFQRLPMGIETTIFRIIQESLTNVYRHSGSKEARVEIARQAEDVLVRIRDYGNGVPPEMGLGAAKSLGVGISGMRERVKQFGGELAIYAAQPGTVVEARIPLAKRHETEELQVGQVSA
jgi:PAS domain S-box-containing protein